MTRDPHRTWHRGFASVVAACTAAFAASAEATVFIWNSTTGGDFLNPANWAQSGDADGIPDADDLPIFNEGTNLNGTVTFSSSVSVSSMQFRSNTGLITFDIGAGKALTVASTVILGSDSDTAQLSLISGTMNAGLFIINASQNASDNNKFTVVNEGTTLNLGSTGFRVGGNGGSGNEATVSNGGDITNAGQIFVGLQGADNSLFTITGTGSSVGGATSITIGGNATTGSNTGTNSRLQVLAGASFTGRTMSLGVGGDPSTGGLAATDNEVTVSGSGTSFTLNNAGNSEFVLDVGRRWQDNTLLVSDGATFTVASGRITIGRESNAGTNNLLHVDNATFTHTDATQGIEVRHGTLRLSNGATVASAKVLLSENGRIEGSGVITANVAAPTETVEDVTTILPGGTAEVGLSPGLLTVNGNWDNANLTIELEADDLTGVPVAGLNYDLLNILGQFTHGGSVVIDVSELVGSEVVKVIGWSTAAGNANDTAVSFVGGPAPDYAFLADGLYLNTIPEPAGVSLLAGSTVLIGVRRRG